MTDNGVAKGPRFKVGDRIRHTDPRYAADIWEVAEADTFSFGISYLIRRGVFAKAIHEEEEALHYEVVK